MTMHWTEDAIREALEGKFFNIHGEDVNEMARLREERRAEYAARVRENALQKAEKVIKKSTGITPEAILHAVAAAHGVTVGMILSKHRFKAIIVARHHAIALMRELTKLSTVAIAEAVNLADHSTVLHATNTWAKRGTPHADKNREARRMLGVGQ